MTGRRSVIGSATAAVKGAVLAVLVTAGTGVAADQVQTRVWDLATDFAGGESYAVERSTTSGTVPGPGAYLTLARHAVYAPDPTELTGNTFWATMPAVMHRLPLAALDHQVVRVGNFIYVIGGEVRSGGAACAVSPNLTVASVYYSEVLPNGDLPWSWTLAGWEFGQTANAPSGIPVSRHRAVAVGNRIYVVGGSTITKPTPGPGQQPATSAVFSTLADPVTGATGPWEQEIPLPVPCAAHGLVYAAGALYVIGGYKNALEEPQRFVHKAEIRPDGHLDSSNHTSWDAVASVPQGDPPGTCAFWCSCPPCAGCDTPCCRSLDVMFGWSWMAPFSLMRTIGFYGGAYQSGDDGSPCTSFGGVKHAFLDDCNGIVGWTGSGASSIDALRRSSAVAARGSMLVAGGYASPSTFPNVLFNPTGRTGSYRTGSADKTELRPALPDGLELFKAETADPSDLGVNAVNPPLVTSANPGAISGTTWVYGVGGISGDATSACSAVYRTRLATTTWWVDAGSWVSTPYDLQGSFGLKTIRWSFRKSGTEANDDWAMFRYRLADETGKWTCWSPRMPEEGSAPTAAGYYTYASDAASSLQREPLIPDRFRYIQFEVSLYNDNGNDAAAPTLPEFDRIEISYAPVVPPRALDCPLEVYPVPAKDRLTLRFEVVPEGGEVTAEAYNAAGDLALRMVFPAYATGGLMTESLDVSGLAPGAYILLVKGRARSGGAGLSCSLSQERSRKIKERFVVRR